MSCKVINFIMQEKKAQIQMNLQYLIGLTVIEFFLSIL